METDHGDKRALNSLSVKETVFHPRYRLLLAKRMQPGTLIEFYSVFSDPNA